MALILCNLLGREVARVADGSFTQGHHVVSFQAGHLPSGLYLHKLDVNGFSAQKKMLLLK